MVSFVTELNTNYYSIQFLKENDCDKYYQYNKKLLFDKQQEEILSELNEVEQDLNTAIIKMPIFISQSPPCQCFYILMLYMMWNFASGYIVWTFGKKIKRNGWILTRYEQESLFS